MTDALTLAVQSLADGANLTADETEAAVSVILEGGASEVLIASFLTGLRIKGETAAELAGSVQAVRARAATAGLSIATPGLIDTCGTGGDGVCSLNVSTAAALLVAACGVPVAKHGNRAASGNSGSAEVLSELGIEVDPPASVVNRCLAELGITFLFAPRFHPGLRSIGALRRQLPFRTLFNLVGPLANPARPDFQLLGVAGADRARLVADALVGLEVRRAAVVTGADGLDEVTLDGLTHVRVVEAGTVTELTWEPADFGLGAVKSADLRVSGPADSAARIRGLLAGEPGPAREIVLANAAAALWVAGESSLRAGVVRAAEAVASGRAARLLDRWREMSQGAV